MKYRFNPFIGHNTWTLKELNLYFVDESSIYLLNQELYTKNWEMQILWHIKSMHLQFTQHINLNFRFIFALPAVNCSLKGDFRHKISLSSGLKAQHSPWDAQN